MKNSTPFALALAALALVGPPASAAPQTTEKQPVEAEGTVRVSFLANEGFLLSTDEAAVVIDGFVSEPYSIYGALPPEALDQMVAGDGAFGRVELALASHYHRDHFQPEPALRFLEAHPGCLLATSPQVLDTIETDLDYLNAAYFPAPGETERLVHGAVTVDFLHLSHGTGRNDTVQNMGHVITLAGVTFLHVGDATMEPQNFAPYSLETRGIDVALLPFWYFGSPEGLRIVKSLASDTEIIVCHIPPRELAQVTKRFAKDHPNVTVPQRALESWSFADVVPAD